MQRRNFLIRAGSMAALAGAGIPSHAATYVPSVPADTGAVGHVVIVGGGMAGTTVAKYLRLWGGARVKVTLIERDAQYVSNIMSNLVLNGARSLASLNYRYDTLQSRYGVQVLRDEVAAIDPAGRSLTTRAGTRIAWDRLIVAPGVDFDTTPGISSSTLQARFPHAWKAGVQSSTLRDQLVAMSPGQTFLMSIPLAPYRCPPGPYERACVVADWLKRNRRGAKVLVLDANPGIVAEPTNFGNAFKNLYAGIIEYIPNAAVSSIDPVARRVFTPMGNFVADVINPIPPHRAAGLASMLPALLNETSGRWAAVDAISYESTAVPLVHVLGDAAKTGLPKAGHVANAEAKVCADAITRILRGDRPDPSPVANSACYSPITATTASWLTAVYRYDSASRQMQGVPGASGEAAGASSQNYSQMEKWFAQLMVDSFA